jgi:phosphonate transport system substrate-binding protein
MGDVSTFTFGLPPSLGKDPQWEMARELAAVLYDAGFTLVVPFKTYKELQQALLAGEVHAAWGPPLLCSHVEAAGGTVALRAVRDGAVTYRSAIVGRARDGFSLETLTSGGFRPRVAWVDEASVAGYLLPRACLRARGIDFRSAFLEERMLGSYNACIDALIGYESDLSALFVGQRGLEHSWGERALRLKTLALTDETPNDGVVVSGTLSSDRAGHLIQSLERMIASDHARRVIMTAFNVDDFDHPVKGTYAPVLALG